MRNAVIQQSNIVVIKKGNMGKGANEMISILFENEGLIKETNFGMSLVYNSEIKLLKRKEENIIDDIKIQKPTVVFLDPNNSKGFIKRVTLLSKIKTETKIYLLVDFYFEHLCWIVKKFSLSGMVEKDSDITIFLKLLFSIQDDNNLCNNLNKTVEPQLIKQTLTETEKRVFKFIGKGLTIDEISKLLGISKRTVEHHKTKIQKKLHCTNSTKLVYIATLYNLFKLF